MERSFHHNHRFSQQHPSLPDSWPLFTSLYNNCTVLALSGREELSNSCVSHNWPWAQQKCCGLRPLWPLKTTNAVYWQWAEPKLAAFWSLTSVALLTTLQLKSFCFPNLLTHNTWVFSLSHHKSKARLGLGEEHWCYVTMSRPKTAKCRRWVLVPFYATKKKKKTQLLKNVWQGI